MKGNMENGGRKDIVKSIYHEGPKKDDLEMPPQNRRGIRDLEQDVINWNLGGMCKDRS